MVVLLIRDSSHRDGDGEQENMGFKRCHQADRLGSGTFSKVRGVKREVSGGFLKY